MQTVALQAGVSVMTVSNVINGSAKVSEPTKRLVLEAINSLGYRPNMSAKALASARVDRIGLIHSSNQVPFMSALLFGALEAANRSGAQIMIRKVDGFDPERLRETVSALITSGANALLVSPPNAELLHQLGILPETNLPVAAVATAGPLDGFMTVRVDEVAAAAEMTGYLIEQGHRRIGFIGGPENHSSAMARLAGFRAAHARHGLAVDPDLIRCGQYTFASALLPAQELLALSSPPSAIFAINDDMAAAVIGVAHRQGLIIPGNVAVAGYDDSLLATSIWPAMTTVHQPIESMGQRAVEMLLLALRGVEHPTDEVVGHSLILRESG